jgi:hypothetical protein
LLYLCLNNSANKQCNARSRMNLTIAPDGMRNERCGELMDVLCITVSMLQLLLVPIIRGFDITLRHRRCITVLAEEVCEGTPPRTSLKMRTFRNFCFIVFSSPFASSEYLLVKDCSKEIIDGYLFTRLDRKEYKKTNT